MGMETRTVACDESPCPVVTDWSEWANSGACSVTCGSGTVTQARNRTCSANCPTTFMGMETRTVACDESPCPVITEWCEWANSGACSVTCGSGAHSQARNRTCSANCRTNFIGMETRTVHCKHGPCPKGHGAGWPQPYRWGQRRHHWGFGTHRRIHHGGFGTHRSRYYGSFGTHRSRFHGSFGTHRSRFHGSFGTHQTGWARRRYGYHG
ncbi:thrombospondin-2-like [Haliotis rubra]|uniref:thrombospondin-2-like n=1 Tax=Haliotis rubra TaxID=36100 RepID=UPI001EE51630|nr:thrombospondin-2-like [Haliotis rubra]